MSDLRKMGMLALGLLGLLVVMSVTFIVGAQFKKSVCEDIDGGYLSGERCFSEATLNASLGYTETDAFNSTTKIITSISTVLGFISVLVIIAIAVVLVQNVRKISNDN